MTTMIAKTYVIPTITAVRTTVAGTQYTVETPEYIDVVTVNGAQTTCTCHEVNCSHIRIVNIRRSQDAAKDVRRDAYSETFNIHA